MGSGWGNGLYIPRIRPIDPHPIDLRRIIPQILDVAQHMALPVLADEVAEVGAQPHVRDRGFVVAPSLDGKAFEEDEALAVEELVADGGEEGGEVREGEIVLERGTGLSFLEVGSEGGRGAMLRDQDGQTFVMPVRGVFEARKSSAAVLNSLISCSLK